MTRPLNFRAERDDYTTSWQRADPRRALIEQTADSAGWLVELIGGTVHTVAYEKRDGAYRGRCNCKGWEYRDDPHSPCAHLCTLRKAEFLGLRDTLGNPIQPTDEPDHNSTVYTTADRVATDGGEIVAPAAGHDGRTFGRPEGRR